MSFASSIYKTIKVQKFEMIVTNQQCNNNLFACATFHLKTALSIIATGPAIIVLTNWNLPGPYPDKSSGCISGVLDVSSIVVLSTESSKASKCNPEDFRILLNLLRIMWNVLEICKQHFKHHKNLNSYPINLCNTVVHILYIQYTVCTFTKNRVHLS